MTKATAATPTAQVASPEPLAVDSATAAKMIGISQRTLADLPDVPRMRVGRRVVFPVHALKEWINQRTTAGGT
jgi:hypothetical protein